MSDCPCGCHGMGRLSAQCTGEYADGGCGHLHRTTALPDLRALSGLGELVAHTGSNAALSTHAPPPPCLTYQPSTEHRCYRGERCASAEKVAVSTCGGDCGHTHRTETARIGGPIMPARGLCLPCLGTTTEAVTGLLTDYTELMSRLADHGTGMAERVSASMESPMPLSVPLLTLAERIVELATYWGELVAEKLHITWDSNLVDHHTRPGVALQRAVRLVAVNMPVLLALTDQPRCEWGPNGTHRTWVELDGLDGALELLRCHELTRLHLRKTRLVHRLPEPCPSCDQERLVRFDGESQVDCRNPRCRSSWTEEDYGRLVHILASEQSEKIRVWARLHGMKIADGARITRKLMKAYRAAEPQTVAS